MKQELRRIKAKDYSQIDQTLFENMARTDNLSSTLSQLGQFQKFLMQQITQLNSSPEKGSESLKCSINQNFETLRESLVQCSRMQSQHNAKSAFRKKLADFEGSLNKMKEQIKEEIITVCRETKKEVERVVGEVVGVLEKERLEKQSLREKISILTKEREMLYHENQELKKNTQTTLNISEGKPHKTYSTQLEGAKIKVEPLQAKINNFGTNGLNIVPSFSDKNQKIRQIISSDYATEVRKYSLTRQTSNHRLPSKQNITFPKQSQLLLCKGAKEQRRPSKQKIRIFSLI